MSLLRNIEIHLAMLTHRAAYLALLACLVTTTALGMQPQFLASSFVESEADSPNEEPGEKEVNSDSRILVRRRGAVLVPTMDVLLALPGNSNRSVKSPPRISCRAAAHGNRNGYGGPLRL